VKIMGSSQAYIAVKGKSPEEIWRDLGLALLDKDSPQQVGHRGPTVGATLESGWYFVLDPEWKLAKDKAKLARLSTGAEVLCGAIEEHCNYAMASGWSNGIQTWSVEHSLSEGDDHLLVVGTPPEPFVEVRDRIIAEREATPPDRRHDFFFSIPVELFESLTGYTYERSCKFVGEVSRLVIV
jgi:hypothetical protein